MKNMLLVLVLFFNLILLLVWLSVEPKTVVYDCGMAEWHPDIPKDVREECRKIRAKSNTIGV